MPEISSTIAVFEKHLSKRRLDAFVDPADPSESRTLARYQANVLICEALYPALHVVEVVVRNHIYAGIARKKGDSWLTNAPERWMRGEEIRKVQEAVASLVNLGRPTEPGRMIAELNFGFWTSLFDRFYERRQNGADLWSGVIRSMFVNMAAGPDKIAAVRARLNGIRELRNRVFHYEPVWHWADLTHHHAEILETIGWISSEMKSYAEKMDRFPEVFASTEPHRVRK